MTGCIFCKIIDGSLPAHKYYEDDNVLAFKDIAPKAPFHAVIIPKTHIASAADIDKTNSNMIAAIFEAAAAIAKENNLDDGFRIVTNSGDHGCQVVPHIHFHLLGGQKLSGDMG